MLKKEINVGQLLTILITLGLVFGGSGLNINSNLIDLKAKVTYMDSRYLTGRDMNNIQLEKISTKLDKISDKLELVQIEVANKANRP